MLWRCEALMDSAHSPTPSYMFLLLCTWHSVLLNISTHCLFLPYTAFAFALCSAWSTLHRSYLYSWFPWLNFTFWQGLSDYLYLHSFRQQDLRWEPHHHLRENKTPPHASSLSPPNALNHLTMLTHFSMYFFYHGIYLLCLLLCVYVYVLWKGILELCACRPVLCHWAVAQPGAIDSQLSSGRIRSVGFWFCFR